MDPHRRVDPDAEVLSDRTAARLLERASELDVRRTAGAQVAELRRRMPKVPQWALTVIAAVLMFAVVIGGVRVVVPSEPVVQATFTLRCLSLDEAHEVVRPILEGDGLILARGPTDAAGRVL